MRPLEYGIREISSGGDHSALVLASFESRGEAEARARDHAAEGTTVEVIELRVVAVVYGVGMNAPK